MCLHGDHGGGTLGGELDHPSFHRSGGLMFLFQDLSSNMVSQEDPRMDRQEFAEALEGSSPFPGDISLSPQQQPLCSLL